jgi:hypothetical protein
MITRKKRLIDFGRNRFVTSIQSAGASVIGLTDYNAAWHRIWPLFAPAPAAFKPEPWSD